MLTFQVFTYDVRGDLLPTNLYVRLSECDLTYARLITQVLAREVVTLDANGRDRDASALAIDGDGSNIDVYETSTGQPLFALRLSESDHDRILADEVL
ncbi:MAG: hypothetical protein MN733_05455 [Nitrososphaera sp.]|nr:hypothetical protein [Nitrososphaera sp.]